MKRNGKIDSGDCWVARLEHVDVLVGVLERWVFVNGVEPLVPDIEYTLEKP